MQRKNVLVLSSLLAVLLLLASCQSMEPKESWESSDTSAKASKALAKADTLAVLGFNTALGVYDRSLDDFMDEGFSSKITLTVEFEGDQRFPINKARVNAHERQLLKALADSNFSFVDKKTVINSDAYKKFNKVYVVGSTDKNATDKELREDAYAHSQEVLVADGYNVTYNNVENRIYDIATAPSSGVLEEVGAEYGLIVVEKPFVQIKNYSVIPEQLIYKKLPYSTMALRTYYYIVKKGMIGTSVVGYKIVYNDGKKNLQETYTTAERTEDAKNYLDDYDVLSEKNNAEFIEWLNSIK